MEKRKGALGLEVKCRYCSEWWIWRLSPYQCPKCGFPIDPIDLCQLEGLPYAL